LSLLGRYKLQPKIGKHILQKLALFHGKVPPCFQLKHSDQIDHLARSLQIYGRGLVALAPDEAKVQGGFYTEHIEQLQKRRFRQP
jgi:hypothetical protein